jgi:hypothetical protein
MDNSNNKNGDWTCVNCGDNNFRFRIKCWKCNTRSVQKSKKLEKDDWVCICGVMNFGRRLICMRCGRSKTDQEKSMNQATSRPGDWICECKENNFTKRKNCRKCDKPNPSPLKHLKSNINNDPNAWMCKQCNHPNSSSRDICQKCHSLNCDTYDVKEGSQCQVCKKQKRNMAIKKCGHYCICDICAFVLGQCPLCEDTFDITKDLIKIDEKLKNV